MIDNLELIKNLLHFNSPDDFYHLSIIKRNKDNPSMDRHDIVIRTYYITSVEKLEYLYPDIKSICKLFNARAYINLNIKSFRKATLMCLKELANRIADNDFNRPYHIFDSVVGQLSSAGVENKRWIVDWDYNPKVSLEENDRIFRTVLNNIREVKYPDNRDTRILSIIPTPNGKHIITRPFNVFEFDNFVPVDIHKNNPTILFYNEGNNT